MNLDFTPSPKYMAMAAKALSACAEEDLWFPKANPNATIAWARHLEYWKFEEDDVLNGVRKMYADNGSGFRPLPKDVVEASRAWRADRCQRETRAEREAREDRRDAALDERALRAIQARAGSAPGRSVPALKPGEAESA